MTSTSMGTRLIAGFGRLVKQTTRVTPSTLTQHTSITPRTTSTTLWSNVWRSLVPVQSYSHYAHTAAAHFRRQACQQFMRRRNASKLPLFAFAGFAFAEQGEEEEDGCVSVGKLVNCLTSDLAALWKTTDEAACHFPDKFRDYTIGERLGLPSSNGAVYSARWRGYDIALKFMFNYSVPSNESAISEAFEREYKVLPSTEVAQMERTDEFNEPRTQREEEEKKRVMSEHPFVVKLHRKFVDDMPLLHDSVHSYPIAVPPRLHSHGYGRNKTLCLVMPRYTCSLREYLNNNEPSKQQCLSILHQLLQGVAHLERHNIAHRDLKSDNILVNVCADDGTPHVVVTDFGCCLFDQDDMRLQYTSSYTDRGGNFALMAPEIATAIPRDGFYLDYSKSDAWACGTLAHEIFNGDNPFYGPLQNTNYKDEDIDKISLRSGWDFIDTMIECLLCRNPDNRLSACECSALLSLFMNAPSEWLLFPYLVSSDMVEKWMLTFTLTTLRSCQMDGGGGELHPKLLSDLIFLEQITFNDVMDLLKLL